LYFSYNVKCGTPVQRMAYNFVKWYASGQKAYRLRCGAATFAATRTTTCLLAVRRVAGRAYVLRSAFLLVGWLVGLSPKFLQMDLSRPLVDRHEICT